MKRCRACHQVLPLSNFQRRPNGAQGVTARCRACIARRYDTETSGVIGAAEGSRARSSPEAAWVPPSSSPANCAAPASRRLRRVTGGSPKVVRPIISSRRSMRRSGQLLVESAGPRTSTPPGGPRAGDGAAAPGQTRSVPPGMTPRPRSSTSTPPRDGTECGTSGAPRCGVPVRSAATCRFDGISLMATSSAPARLGKGSMLTESVGAGGWRCTACRWMTTNAWPESRASDVPSAAGRRLAWTPMAPLLSITTTRPGLFEGCSAACATPGWAPCVTIPRSCLLPFDTFAPLAQL
jgi:hypothetical protein